MDGQANVVFHCIYYFIGWLINAKLRNDTQVDINLVLSVGSLGLAHADWFSNSM